MDFKLVIAKRSALVQCEIAGKQPRNDLLLDGRAALGDNVREGSGREEFPMIMLKDALVRLRRERGLTQEELARRLYITRQAVSRWECGATEPGIDMLKLIARELDVPVTALLDMPEHYCQSCGMMFTGPGQHGHEADGSETEDFCRWCYEGGAYTYEATMDEMIEDCAPRMAEAMGWTVDEATSLLGAVLPGLERWRPADERPCGTHEAAGLRVALRRAKPSDAGAVASVVAETIRSVYPRYYPEPVVAKFLELHSEDAIAEDVRGGKIVVAEADGAIVGTGTVEGRHISRVFVLPGFQGRGVGSAILDELEARAAAPCGSAVVESSLPACALYERRGYRTVTHGSWDVPPAGDLPAATLVWEVMEKPLRPAPTRG